MISVALSFIRRDLLIWTSYRFSFVWQVLAIVGVTVMLYFLGHLIGGQANTAVKGVSTDYFDFLVSGIAFTDVFTFGLNSFPRTIRDGQQAGTLETMLLAHFRLFPIVLYSSLFNFLMSLMRLVIFVALAVFSFGLWNHANILSVVVVFVLATAVFACLGILSSAFILVLKQGDPVIGVYAVVSAALGGLFFPVTLLPSWVQPLANFVPLTHALTGIRLALRGEPLSALGVQIFSLLIMLAIFLPTCLLAFNWAINRAKEEGSLVQY